MASRTLAALFFGSAFLGLCPRFARADSDEGAAVRTGYQYGDTQPTSQTDGPYERAMRLPGGDEGASAAKPPPINCKTRGPISPLSGGCPGPMTVLPDPVHDAPREKDKASGILGELMALVKTAKDAAVSAVLSVLGSAARS